MQKPKALVGIRGKLKRNAYLQAAKVARNFRTRDKPEVLQNLLIINLQNIGDLLIAVPALSNLSKKVQRIDVLTSPVAKGFIKTLPFIHEVFDENEQEKLFHHSKQYDGIIDFQDTFTTMERAKMPLQIDSAWRVGVERGGFIPWCFDDAIEKKFVHMTEHARRLIERGSNFKIENEDFTWPIQRVARKELHGLFAEGNKNVIVHIPNKNKNKRWLPRNFSILMKKISEAHQGKVRFFLTGVESERKLIDQVRNQLSGDLDNSVVDCISRFSPGGLIELLRSVDLLVTVDTGIFHLAAMTKTPTVGLFGPTTQQYWGGWSDYHHVISLPLSCRPKENLEHTLALTDHCCLYADPKCMYEIGANEVFAKCKELLDY